ncbi:MAG: hypothetical protein ABH833_00205 [Parcubacteria group bacterium]
MKWHVYAMLVLATVTVIGMAMIIYKTSPEEASGAIRALFFVTLFVLLWTITSLISIAIQNRISDKKSRQLIIHAYIHGIILTGLIALIIAIKHI